MRVLAITGNASLVVALGSMMRDWEVVTVRSADEAVESAQDAVVALIDLSGTTPGIEVADKLYRAGVTIPCVIIGDDVADHPRASILVRPFSLEDLGGAVRVAAERGPSPAPPPPARPAAEEPEASRKSTPPAPPPSERPVERPRAAGAPAAATAPATEAPEKRAPARRGSLSVVRPQPEPAEEKPAEAPAASAAPAEAAPAAPEKPTVDEPARSTADIVRSQLEETSLREPEPVQAPQPPPAAPPPTTPPPAAQPPVRQEPVLPPAPAARSEVQAEPAARWRRKRKPTPAEVQQETESPLVRRLRAAAGWAQEVEDLLDELPVLGDLWAMADALAGEMEVLFGAQVASVFARTDEGYHAVAHRGLSRVEAGMVVPETQPLFSDVIRTQEGILIQPVDLAQGLVAGIGGARTEAMMAAPVVAQGQCIAIVVVGGDRFAETDLDRLSDLATEAAPGLAVARLLQRLSGRSPS